MIWIGFCFAPSYLSQLLEDGVQAFVLRLGVGEDVAWLADLGLQLQDPLLVVGLLTGWLLDKRLLTALPICCYLPVVGVGLSKGLEIYKWLVRSCTIMKYKWICLYFCLFIVALCLKILANINKSVNETLTGYSNQVSTFSDQGLICGKAILKCYRPELLWFSCRADLKKKNNS